MVHCVALKKYKCLIFITACVIIGWGMNHCHLKKMFVKGEHPKSLFCITNVVCHLCVFAWFLGECHFHLRKLNKLWWVTFSNDITWWPSATIKPWEGHHKSYHGNNTVPTTDLEISTTSYHTDWVECPMQWLSILVPASSPAKSLCSSLHLQLSQLTPSCPLQQLQYHQLRKHRILGETCS